VLVVQTLLAVFKLREDPQGRRTSLEILQITCAREPSC